MHLAWVLYRPIGCRVLCAPRDSGLYCSTEVGVWISTPSLSLKAMCQVSCDTDLGQGSHCVEGASSEPSLVKAPPHKAIQGAGRVSESLF